MKLAPAASVAPSSIREIARLADSFPGTLRLYFGEDTLPTPDFIKQAAQLALNSNRTYYTPNAGYPAVRAAFASNYSGLHGVEIDPETELVVTASGMMALQLAIKATIGPGDSAQVISPVWPNFVGAVRVTGAEPIEVPLQLGESRYQLDRSLLERTRKPNTRALILASPGNPTGWVASPDEWQEVVDYCEQHDLWLIADGVYERILFETDRRAALSPLKFRGARERTIVVQSMSKAYRMTGWRIGYAITPPSLASVLAFLQEYDVSHAFGVAQEAARVAVLQGEPFLDEARDRYERHRAIAVQRLQAIKGIQVPIPEGAFYVFPRLEGLSDSMSFCKRLIQEYGLGVAPGIAFGETAEGHIRLCFAVDQATLESALERFETAWKAIGSNQ